MSADLNPIAQITISKDGPALSATGFGGAAIVCANVPFTDPFRVYTDPSQLTSDGFATYHPAYRALAIAKQNGFSKLVVARHAAGHTHTQTLVPTTATAGQHLRCKVIDPTTGVATQIDRTVPGSSTLAAEATALAALIDAMAGVVCSASSTTVTVTPATAGRVVYIYDLENLEIEDTTADAGYDDTLAALALTDADFWAVTLDTWSDANHEAAAVWCAANERGYFGTSQSTKWLAGTATIGDDLDTNENVLLTYHPRAHDLQAIAVMAPGARYPAGSFTYGLKQPKGGSAKRLTPTQISNLEAHGLGYITKVRNLTVYFNGKTCGGEWLDITHGTAAWAAATQEAIVSLLVNVDKVDFDNGGADMIRNRIEAVGAQYTRSRLFKEGTFAVSMPDADADPEDPTAVNPVSDADRLTRYLNGIVVTAKYRGAAQRVGIRANLSF